MSLKQKITDDMKAAMRAGDVRQRDTIRLLQAAIKQKEIDGHRELDDTAIITVIEKMLKQRRDSVQQYEAAQRHDLATVEKEEMNILSVYMPRGLSEEEIDKLVIEAISIADAKGMQDMGKVMTILKPNISGRADMGKVSAIVKTKIAG
ncbi:hypothetical protein SAMN05421690_1002168 [Nitrosomonas sp. Nm51]|uniref:GatB/YqeY domain-containing protein n=1 Tax=Nitrosomonas sp. Nm51 TaxID=133720 RepID=UPI0008AF36DD|nr:GatB/YqeY domain-containing protein [Nitrosomonas sp. Nm51]SEQ86701.1 hypothetical protein SAMN05421690_1002168 [Nitrosomonas sp. Nm51]